MKQIKIGGRLVGERCATLIVAEIGNNHNGSVAQAKCLIEAAAEAKADAVKFQCHIADEEMLPVSPNAGHFPEPRYEFTKRIELSEDEQCLLKRYAESKGLLFFSTPVSRAAVDLLERLGVHCFKIGSGDVTDLLLLDYVAQKGKPILLSTGMSSWIEIEQAKACVEQHGVPLILMQCSSIYPCPYAEVGLSLIPEMRQRFNVPVGLSDDTPTAYTAIASVVFGTAVVEKHLTLNKTLYGPDHRVSLVPEELAQLVDGIRAVELALRPIDKGDVGKFAGVRDVFQKSLVSAMDIKTGTVMTRDMITSKRPGTGISPVRIQDVIGKKATLGIPANKILTWDALESL